MNYETFFLTWPNGTKGGGPPSAPMLLLLCLARLCRMKDKGTPFFFFKYKTQINTTSATANDGVAEAFITHLKLLLKYDFYLFSQSGWSVIKILTLTLCSSHFSTMWSTSPPRTEIFESSSSKRPFLTWTVPRSFTFVPGGVLKLKNKIKKK